MLDNIWKNISYSCLYFLIVRIFHVAMPRQSQMVRNTLWKLIFLSSILIDLNYCSLDERFAQLTALVKKWASATGVKNPKGGGFNSYGLTLLVLHFMHCGVYPPVLPNLQGIHPGSRKINCYYARFYKEPNYWNSTTVEMHILSFI